MTEQDFLRILRFYLDCIEAEDRRSLTTNLSALHHSVLSPWDAEETFFYPENAEVVFEAELASDRNLLLGGAALAGVAERFFYGYPVFLSSHGFLSPLFVAEVDVQLIGANSFSMRHANAGEIQLNHHLFRDQHLAPEELRVIQEELEGEYGSFADRLRAAFEALGLPVPDLAPERLEPYPMSDSPRNKWLNRPILFKSERSVYTHHLRRELAALAEHSQLSNALGNTAAGVLAGTAQLDRGGARRPGADPAPLVQVLPLNTAQEAAARAALESPLTVVTGPPGTGKSQIVVDLLASCALAGRPVLFASKNNRAVDVVRERLRMILGEERDWTLRLGSREVMDKSRQEMDNRLGSLQPGMTPPSPAPKLLYQLDQEVAGMRRQIEKVARAQTEYAGLERDLRVAEDLVEPDWVDSWAEALSSSPDLPRLERLTATAEALVGKRPARFWLRLKHAFAPAAVLRGLWGELAVLTAKLPPQVREDLNVQAQTGRADQFIQLAESCAKLNRLALWRFADDRCGRALAAIRAEEPADVLARGLDQLQGRRAELSCDQLRAAWTGRLASRAGPLRNVLGQYFDLSSRLRKSRGRAFLQVLEQLKTTLQRVGSEFPVWVVTNLSVRNALPLEPALFDLVIVDEASQCDIPSALPLLFRARRALIIGDPCQLSHISTLRQSEEERLASQNGVADLLTTWSYNQRSLYAVAEKAAVDQDQQLVFLSEHYRSHPEIIDFSNREFYKGQLILRTALESIRKRLRGEALGIFWHDVQGAVPRSSHSAVNEIEVHAVLDLLDEWVRTGFLLRNDVGFGIVTPFRLQMERIAEAVQ
ncbi:MAG: AAA domain-containing protein, partial [Bryobacteraceae bacterium]